MDFERYRIPRSVTEGVRIELPGTTGAEFLVALPSQANRKYQAAQQRALSAGGGAVMGEDNTLDLSNVDIAAYSEARLLAFLDTCVLSFPDGLTRDQLLGDYYPGAQALFDRALDLAADEEGAAKVATKKFRA